MDRSELDSVLTEPRLGEDVDSQLSRLPQTETFTDETFTLRSENLSLAENLLDTESNSSRRPDGLDVERLYSAFQQLAEGLNALHAMGKVHRDLKPSNVMVDWNGRVVVLDFGLSTELKGLDDPQATEQGIIGTISYMSPEQAAGRVASAASDWYCVGVMLFQALTGRLPFEGRRADVLLAKQTSEPPDPGALAENLPEDLRQLCVELLRLEPDARPDGDEVLRRLGKSSAATHQPTRPAARSDRPFLGRERQLKMLGEAFEATHRGKTTTAFVHGRSGAGKSALVHEFLKSVTPREDVVVLEGRCFEQESVAYKALDALIDALSRYLRRLNRLEVEAILPRDIAPLARVFPVLNRIDAVADAPQRSVETSDAQELRRRAFAALRELLARVGDRHILILYIDDLQWGDLDSAELISELLHPPDAPVLLLLCCYRSEYADASPCLKRLLGVEESAPGFRRLEIEVGALTREEARDLASLLLRDSGPVAEPLVDVVARESGGSPFFVYELVHYLIQGGELSTSSEHVAGSLSLDEVLWRRVQELPLRPRRLLEVIAVAGQPIRQAIACRSAEMGSEGFSALAFLRANNLVKRQGGGVLDEVEAYHDRIRETIIRRLDPGAIAAWHRVLASEMEEAGQADPETLAVFFESAGQKAKASRYFTDAADDAVQALAFERAAKLYRRVLDLRPADDPENLSVQVRLAEALANSGRSGEAGETYLAAASTATLEEAHELQARAAYQFLICGRIDEGQAAFHGVLARVGLSRPSTPNKALLALLRERLILACRGLRFRER
ncbi:MAG TPA: AAA family ATPase, partial [Isosphaeraceae bacterium]|nr:AAA family ATPase [Isosphaeraceae bacterium]